MPHPPPLCTTPLWAPPLLPSTRTPTTVRTWTATAPPASAHTLQCHVPGPCVCSPSQMACGILRHCDPSPLATPLALLVLPHTLLLHLTFASLRFPWMLSSPLPASTHMSGDDMSMLLLAQPQQVVASLGCAGASADQEDVVKLRSSTPPPPPNNAQEPRSNANGSPHTPATPTPGPEVEQPTSSIPTSALSSKRCRQCRTCLRPALKQACEALPSLASQPLSEDSV